MFLHLKISPEDFDERYRKDNPFTHFKGFVGLVCILASSFGIVSEISPSVKAKYKHTDKHLPIPFHHYSEKS